MHAKTKDRRVRAAFATCAHVKRTAERQQLMGKRPAGTATVTRWITAQDRPAARRLPDMP
jgi:hypothetical protein